MIVEEIMQTNVYTLKPTDKVMDAVRLMREKKVRHLPIVNENEEVVGIVTDHDIKNALPSCLREEPNSVTYEALIEEMMVKNPIIGHPLDFVEEVALTFYENKISCLPIKKGNTLVGIISESDLLHTFVKFTGADQPGSHIEIKVPNKVGILHGVTAIFKNKNLNILSILMRPDQIDENYVIIVIRVKTMNPLSIVSDLTNNGFTVLWPKAPELLS